MAADLLDIPISKKDFFISWYAGSMMGDYSGQYIARDLDHEFSIPFQLLCLGFTKQALHVILT